MTRTNVCVFAAQEDLETMQAFAQVSSEMSTTSGRKRSVCVVEILGRNNAWL